jgi:Adenosine-deaminase (editase) domain
LTETIRRDLVGDRTAGSDVLSILQRCDSTESSSSPATLRYTLKPGVTLHVYCSSSPCGNSVLKKFCTMQKEVYQDQFSDNEWPVHPHEAMPGHSIPLGQFALLVKKDNNSSIDSTDTSENSGNSVAAVNPVSKKRKLSKKQEQWPVNSQMAWCPPGTTTVWSGQGSLHTCSDKLARWNCLGLQGSLLASILTDPLYMSSLTVGRKFSAVTCRRAVCCRLVTNKCDTSHRSFHDDTASTNDNPQQFRLHHPTVMGTAVYMDETGVIDMTVPNETGQDVRFYSSQSWVSWLLPKNEYAVECIDGFTGYAVSGDDSSPPDKQLTEISSNLRSQISTAALVKCFLEIESVVQQSSQPSSSNDDYALISGLTKSTRIRSVPATLHELRCLKASLSSPYEKAKSDLLTKHPVLRDWKRREELVQSKDAV